MNRDTDGIDALRAAIDEVAAGLPAGDRSSSRRRIAPWIAAAAALLIVAFVATRLFRPAAHAEVTVVELKVNGLPVPARVVDGAAPSTILVMPRPEPARPMAAVTFLTGGIE